MSLNMKRTSKSCKIGKVYIARILQRHVLTHSRVTRIVSELAKLSASPRKTASHANLHFAVESGLANVTHPSEFECVLACLSNSREI